MLFDAIIASAGVSVDDMYIYLLLCITMLFIIAALAGVSVDVEADIRETGDMLVEETDEENDFQVV